MCSQFSLDNLRLNWPNKIKVVIFKKGTQVAKVQLEYKTYFKKTIEISEGKKTIRNFKMQFIARIDLI